MNDNLHTCCQSVDVVVLNIENGIEMLSLCVSYVSLSTYMSVYDVTVGWKLFAVDCTAPNGHVRMFFTGFDGVVDNP